MAQGCSRMTGSGQEGGASRLGELLGGVPAAMWMEGTITYNPTQVAVGIMRTMADAFPAQARRIAGVRTTCRTLLVASDWPIRAFEPIVRDTGIGLRRHASVLPRDLRIVTVSGLTSAWPVWKAAGLQGDPATVAASRVPFEWPASATTSARYASGFEDAPRLANAA